MDVADFVIVTVQGLRRRAGQVPQEVSLFPWSGPAPLLDFTIDLVHGVHKEKITDKAGDTWICI
jgi:hypothetical protein